MTTRTKRRASWRAPERALLLLLGLSAHTAHARDEAAPPAPVYAQIDWQGHPAMHIPWRMFARGLTDRPLSHRTWRHMFRQTVSAPTLGASEVRIFLAAAMAAERARNPTQARRLILKQLAYVEAFVAAHPDQYALARTPAEAREILATSDRMVIIHSIEGGHHLLSDPQEDARFWATQGVALVTLIHLRDDELGGADLLEGPLGRLINPRGARALRREQRRGLTPLGREAMQALDAAGILVDLSHMAPDALADALEVAAEAGIPPVLTHTRLEEVRRGEFAISEQTLVEVYRLGGVLSLGLSAENLVPERAGVPAPEGLCWGTVEAWAWAHQVVQARLQANVATIFETPGLTWAMLDEEQQVRLATGWSSDWNGWLSHSRPTHGRGRCQPRAGATGALDTRGLAHPGLLPEHWAQVEAQGVSLTPMLQSAERFLQLWEQVSARTPAP